MQGWIRNQRQGLCRYRWVLPQYAQLSPNGPVRKHTRALHMWMSDRRRFGLQIKLYVRRSWTERWRQGIPQQCAMQNMYLYERCYKLCGTSMQLFNMASRGREWTMLSAMRSETILPTPGAQTRHVPQWRTVDISMSNVWMFGRYNVIASENNYWLQHIFFLNNLVRRIWLLESWMSSTNMW